MTTLDISGITSGEDLLSALRAGILAEIPGSLSYVGSRYYESLGGGEWVDITADFYYFDAGGVLLSFASNVYRTTGGAYSTTGIVCHAYDAFPPAITGTREEVSGEWTAWNAAHAVEVGHARIAYIDSSEAVNPGTVVTITSTDSMLTVASDAKGKDGEGRTLTIALGGGAAGVIRFLMDPEALGDSPTLTISRDSGEVIYTGGMTDCVDYRPTGSGAETFIVTTTPWDGEHYATERRIYGPVTASVGGIVVVEVPGETMVDSSLNTMKLTVTTVLGGVLTAGDGFPGSVFGAGSSKTFDLGQSTAVNGVVNLSFTDTEGATLTHSVGYTPGGHAYWVITSSGFSPGVEAGYMRINIRGDAVARVIAVDTAPPDAPSVGETYDWETEGNALWILGVGDANLGLLPFSEQVTSETMYLVVPENGDLIPVFLSYDFEPGKIWFTEIEFGETNSVVSRLYRALFGANGPMGSLSNPWIWIVLAAVGAIGLIVLIKR